MTDHVTLRERINSTRYAIVEEGVLVALNRPSAPASDGAGGMTRNGVSTPQTAVKRLLVHPTADLNEETADDGERTLYPFVLIGVPGDDMSEGDTFTANGLQYQINHVHPDKTFQVKGEGTVFLDG